MAAIKVKAWGEGQGDFVWIEEENFDLKVHEKFEDEERKKPGPKPKQKGE